MAGVFNRGKYLLLEEFFLTAGAPTNIFAALVTSATAPVVDHNTLSELTEITAGWGYTEGGYSLNRNGTDFDSLVENDTDDRAEVQAKDIVWTASGGPIPLSGDGARYMVFTDDNATVGNRQLIAWFDLGSDRSVSDGQSLTIQNAEVRLTE